MPRFRQHAEMMQGQRSALRVAADESGTAATPFKVKAEPGDLRGIPVIGQGVGGASPGTSPHTAIERLDRIVSFA